MAEELHDLAVKTNVIVRGENQTFSPIFQA
jgi:hypothetical protein